MSSVHHLLLLSLCITPEGWPTPSAKQNRFWFNWSRVRLRGELKKAKQMKYSFLNTEAFNPASRRERQANHSFILLFFPPVYYPWVFNPQIWKSSISLIIQTPLLERFVTGGTGPKRWLIVEIFSSKCSNSPCYAPNIQSCHVHVRYIVGKRCCERSRHDGISKRTCMLAPKGPWQTLLRKRLHGELFNILNTQRTRSFIWSCRELVQIQTALCFTLWSAPSSTVEWQSTATWRHRPKYNRLGLSSSAMLSRSWLTATDACQRAQSSAVALRCCESNAGGLEAHVSTSVIWMRRTEEDTGT